MYAMSLSELHNWYCKMFEKEVNSLGRMILNSYKEIRDGREFLIKLNEEAAANEEELIRLYESIPQSKTPDASSCGETKDRIASLKSSIKQRRSLIDDLEQELSSAGDGEFDPTCDLAPFEFGALPVELQAYYPSACVHFDKTRNPHYALEVFCKFANKNITPPAWAIRVISDAFSTYLNDPEGDPDKAVKLLGLKGVASGSTSPRDEIKMRRRRSPAMVDMGILIDVCGISRARAAKAAKLKYDLEESHKTLSNYFYVYFDRNYHTNPSRQKIELNSVERTKFIQSFPVSARKLMSSK